VAKFAAGGKPTGKKDLGLMATSYGNVYVAQVAMGANDLQTLKAFIEAEAFNGPSIIIAYSHCIAHGIDMTAALDQQVKAVDSAYWPLFRYDPRKIAKGESPLKLDSPAPKIALAEFAKGENRFNQVRAATPEAFQKMLDEAQKNVRERYALYEQLSKAMNPANLIPGGAGAAPKAQA
jgi:pyruvate-ferredoxin/flavodoxin oxidoreductase